MVASTDVRALLKASSEHGVIAAVDLSIRFSGLRSGGVEACIPIIAVLAAVRGYDVGVRSRRLILFNAFTSMSIVLLCGILGLAAWVACVGERSFEFGFDGSLWRLQASSDRFRVDNEPQRELEERPLKWMNRYVARMVAAPPPSDSVELQAQYIRWNAANSLLNRLARRPGPLPVGWEVSYGLLFAVVATLPAGRVVSSLLRARRRARLHARRVCVYCQYDIRESEVVCPECGKRLPVLHRTTSEVAEKLSRVRF